MPAKKTFYSIRVRGPVRFDHRPTAQGIVMPLFEEYVAYVEVSQFDIAVDVLYNSFQQPFTWSVDPQNAGRAIVHSVGAFPAHKHSVMAICKPGVYEMESILQFAYVNENSYAFQPCTYDIGVMPAGGFYVTLKRYK